MVAFINSTSDQIFFEHVRNVIIELNEPRTLRSLLLDYQNITKNFGISIENMKSSKVKELIQETFGEEICFHERYHKNESIIVFKRNAGGSFIEFAIYSGEYQKNKYYILQQKG